MSRVQALDCPQDCKSFQYKDELKLKSIKYTPLLIFHKLNIKIELMQFENRMPFNFFLHNGLRQFFEKFRKQRH